MVRKWDRMKEEASGPEWMWSSDTELSGGGAFVVGKQ